MVIVGYGSAPGMGMGGGAAGEDLDALDGWVGEEEVEELVADQARGAEEEGAHGQRFVRGDGLRNR